MNPSFAISFENCARLEEHAQLVMNWRNDEETLRYSFHQEKKIWTSFWPEYQNNYFLDSTLPVPQFILINGERCGFLRFRPMAHPLHFRGKVCDISVIIAPDKRGQGIARQALLAIDEILLAHGIDSVVAQVKTAHPTSRQLFEKAGYVHLGESLHQVEDTGETCGIWTLHKELTPTHWRKNGVYIIAEVGSNWRMGAAKRDIHMARILIESAAAAGANGVKFQTYRAESVYVANAGQSSYLAEAGIKEDISDIFSDLEMPYEMIPRLAEICQKNNIDFLSTGFSREDFLAIDPFVTVHKIASYEISHAHLLTLAAQSGKPLILSTGASGPEDIRWAVNHFRQQGGKELCLMQCTASYPAPLDSMNLATLPWLQRQFGVTTGLSDHSREVAVAPIVAVALGARVIEKHFTLHNQLPGPDHAFAITPEELASLVVQIRQAEKSLGSGVKQVQPVEKELAAYARRGLQAIRPIAVGERLQEGVNYAILRPGQQRLGLHPRHLDRVEGKTATRPIAQGDGLQAGDGQ